MKAKFLIKLMALSLLLLCVANAPAQKVKEKEKPVEVRVEKEAEQDEPPVVQTMAVDQNVVITLSVLSGSLTVRGWDQKQVRVEASGEKRIELRRNDGADANAPATRLQVLFYESDDERRAEECGGATDVTLNVPRGATVQLKTQEGDIDVSDVAEARVNTVSGDLVLRHISRSVDATTANGDVSLRDSRGEIRLTTFSGSVEAANISANNQGDFLFVKAVSGDVILERIEQARVEAGSISGEVSLTGPLARGGHYDFKTTSGDITLNLPENSSFKLDAQVFDAGEFDSSFPLKLSGTLPNAGHDRRTIVVGTYGTGDASINLNSFSGTLRLRKN
ncbi:MAG TPA: DUF4097 family beta strand repeat-containing protein [Pyrinomonadaceae bacterium]|jgi:DUF4097 and DUF4098 domain-containing protein YvlB